jgi:hypothetical protein
MMTGIGKHIWTQIGNKPILVMVAYPSRSLNDDGDGQVHVVGVDKAHGHPRVAGKRRMHSIVCQNLRKNARIITYHHYY